MWRGLETTHGSDTEALSTETESKQSRPNLRSIGASPRPYRAPESDGHRLSRCNSNQMHVQRTSHLLFALFTAKFNSRTVHSWRRPHNLLDAVMIRWRTSLSR